MLLERGPRRYRDALGGMAKGTQLGERAQPPPWSGQRASCGTADIEEEIEIF